MADPRSDPGRPSRSRDNLVGDFIIDSVIGQGSFANVYLGVHKDSKEIVAVKSVELKKLSPKLKDNLYGEITILKKLRHPHIVALHDCIRTPTHINLVMEYCELGDLSLLIKKRDKLSTHPVTHDMARKYPASPNGGLHEVVIRHFLKQMASAMEFLRVGNYVHRDIKPQNLLLLPSPQYREANSRPIMVASKDSLIPAVGLVSLPMLKLADFGFARVLPSTSLADTLCGSPLYMAPEILRYEKYDSKADLWSVGTVLYEMAAGKPPHKARNHMELLRKIEQSQDHIKFPRDSGISEDLKSLIRALLKRSAESRLGWDAFFHHVVVLEDIPGLIEDDVPKPTAVASVDATTAVAAQGERPIERTLSRRSLSRMTSARSNDDLPGMAAGPTTASARTPRDFGQLSPRLSRPPLDAAPRHTFAPTATSVAAATGRQLDDDSSDGLGIRPRPHTARTSPGRPQRLSDAAARGADPLRDYSRASGSSSQRQQLSRQMTEEEKAAQDVADMREYVVIEKKQVEINAFADEVGADPGVNQHGDASSSGPIAIRQPSHRATSSTGGAAAGTTGSTSQSPQSQALIGRNRQDSTGSPTSTSSYLTKAIQEASMRFLGYYRQQLTHPIKNQSPPSYNPFGAHPAPAQPVGLIGDGRPTSHAGAGGNDDSRNVQSIEDLATRSDVVFGFAEVKFQQIFPHAPSADRNAGGENAPEDDLTIDAIVSLSEEALVLYIKVLTLLARAMDTADTWWRSTKRAIESGNRGGDPVPLLHSQPLVHRVNAVVQWIRTRFNQVLEKTEAVKLKLVDSQAQLPDTHPSHPGTNVGDSSTSSNLAGGVPIIATGVTAEKLMYERALEMSRAAAIREISHNDLPGCEISYLTAIRMLEVVVDSDDYDAAGAAARKRVSTMLGEPGRSEDDDALNLDKEDQESVRKLIALIQNRLTTVRGKIRDIAEAEKEQQQALVAARRRSGEGPRSHPVHGSPY